LRLVLATKAYQHGIWQRDSNMSGGIYCLHPAYVYLWRHLRLGMRLEEKA